MATPKEIQERREKINLMLAKGYNQMDITRELGITRMTLNRDMHYINKTNNRVLYDLAKEAFASEYINCVEGSNEILKKAWEYINSNDPRINHWIKLGALRLAHEVQHHKFIMFQNGPATMHLGKMHEEIEEIRRIALVDRSDTFTTRGDNLNLNRGLPSSSPYHDFNVRDLDKP